MSVLTVAIPRFFVGPTAYMFIPAFLIIECIDFAQGVYWRVRAGRDPVGHLPLIGGMVLAVMATSILAPSRVDFGAWTQRK